MKISVEQLKKAFQYGSQQKEGSTKLPFSTDELSLLVEALKQMPEKKIRHLNYSMIKEECEKISSEDVAEKLLMKRLVDKLFEQTKENKEQ